MRDDLRLTPGGRVEHIDADRARPEQHQGDYVSPLVVPPAHPTLAHLDTRDGRGTDLAATLATATAEQLDAAAKYTRGEELRLVRRELLLRHLPIPLPTRRR